MHPTSTTNLLILLAAVVLFGQLFLFGGTLPLYQLPWVALTAILAIVTAFTQPQQGPSSPLLILALLIILPMAWGWAQILPIWHTWAHPMYQSLEFIPSVVPAPISLNASKFLPVALATLHIGLSFFLFYRLGTQAPLKVLHSLALAGSSIMLYAITNFALGNHNILWLPKPDYLTDLTGTFVNRNHFATFMGLTLLLVFTYWLHRMPEVPSPRRANTRTRLQAIMVLVLKPRWMWLILAFMSGMVLMLTHSRAGLMVSFAGLLLLTGLLATQIKGARMFLITLLGAIILAGSFLMGSMGQQVSTRLGNLAKEAIVRAHIYQTGQTLIEQNPYLGTGVGTFEQAFRISQPITLSRVAGRIDYAHNTWLEWAIELGLPAFLCFILAFFWLVYIHIQGLRHRHQGVIYPALGLATLGLVGGHALVDFSAQIPALSAFVAAILGLTTAQSLVNTHSAPTPGKRWHILPVTGLGIIGMALTAYLWVPTMWQASIQSQLTSIMAGQGGTLPHTQLINAKNQIQRMHRWRPTPLTHQQIASTYIAMQQSGHTSQALLQSLTRRHLISSIQGAPANPYAWHMLAHLQAQRGQPQLAVTALSNSLLTGPTLTSLLWARIKIGSVLWPHMDADTQHLFCTNVQNAWQLSHQKTAQALNQGPHSLHIAQACLPTTPLKQLKQAGFTGQE